MSTVIIRFIYERPRGSKVHILSVDIDGYIIREPAPNYYSYHKARKVIITWIFDRSGNYLDGYTQNYYNNESNVKKIKVGVEIRGTEWMFEKLNFHTQVIFRDTFRCATGMYYFDSQNSKQMNICGSPLERFIRNKYFDKNVLRIIYEYLRVR